MSDWDRMHATWRREDWERELTRPLPSIPTDDDDVEYVPPSPVLHRINGQVVTLVIVVCVIIYFVAMFRVEASRLPPVPTPMTTLVAVPTAPPPLPTVAGPHYTEAVPIRPWLRPGDPPQPTCVPGQKTVNTCGLRVEIR